MGSQFAPRFNRQAPSERRFLPRYPAVLQRAWIGWREEAALRAVPARLLDLSHGGCQVEILESPGVNRSALLWLDGHVLPRAFATRIVDLRPAAIEGRYRARLLFPEGCPYALFMAVACGRIHADVDERHPPIPDWVQPESGSGERISGVGPELQPIQAPG